MGINPYQLLRPIQVRFVHAKNAFHALVARNGRHPVDKKRLRYGIHIGGKDHQCIHIGHCRADKAVFSGQDLLHHALLSLPGHNGHIPRQRGQPLLSENPPGLAGQCAVRQDHVIKAAEGPNDPACF